MLNFRDTGIRKARTPSMAIINSDEKKLFIILAMISISIMKNSVYNLIGLEDSCTCDHRLTESFCKLRLLKTPIFYEIGTNMPKSDRLLYVAWPVLQMNEH